MMKRQALFFGILCGLFVAACSRGGGTPEQRFIRDVANALGGVSAVQGTKTLVFESGVEGDGERYWLGENRNPDADFPVFRTLFRSAFDWPNGRFRKEELRIAQFVSSNDQMRTVMQGLDGDIAYDVGVDMKAIKQPADVLRDRKLELLMHPIGLIQAALAPGAVIGPVSTSGGNETTEIKLPNGGALTLVVDAATKLPSHISARVEHPILGDVVEDTEFGDYQKNPTSGAMLPANFVLHYDNKPIAKFRAVKQTVNFDGSLPIPDATTHQAFAKSVRLEVPPILKNAPVQPRETLIGDDSIASMPVVANVVAPGVWYLQGGDYYSGLVELSDHLVLFDVPVDDQRFNAIVAKAAELVPGKKITEAIVSHHHFDHLGGVRAAMAAGLTLYVRGNTAAPSANPEQGRAAPSLRSAESFYEDIARRPHTIEPDTLQKAPKAPILKTVDDKVVLGDATRSIELYPIDGSEYADTVLMAYLPKEKLLMEADVYTPPADIYNTLLVFPFSKNLVENIDKRGLKVEKIVPAHGHIVPMGDLIKSLTAIPSTQPMQMPQ